MNRKQRRATMKLGSSASANSSGEQIRQYFFEAVSHERSRRLDDAARTYKRILALDPDHAEACNNLGRVLQAQGKTKDGPPSSPGRSGSCRTPGKYAISGDVLSLLPGSGNAPRRARLPHVWLADLSTIDAPGNPCSGASSPGPKPFRVVQERISEMDPMLSR